jgi:Cu(I)/Ag(I) efflux system membrane fusion protein
VSSTAPDPLPDHAGMRGSERRPAWMRAARSLLLVALIAGAAGTGFRLGRSDLPLPGWVPASLSGWIGAKASMTPAKPEPSGPVIYYRDPDGKPVYSAEPRKAADGRDFIAVRQSEEISFDPAPVKTAEAPAGGGKKLLYYRNPMGLPDTSPVPKKDWMGMDYLPVYEGEEENGSSVKVSLDKVQRAGVRTEPAALRNLSRAIRAPGIAKPDERTLHSVVLRADSFIEKLHANELGQKVEKGTPLFRVYSPDMVRVQVDYRIANAGTGSREERGALQRLQNLQIPSRVVEELQRTREPVISFDWPSPVSGVVLRRKAVEGMMMRSGEEMMLIADPSRIWVIADIAEQDIGDVTIGAKAKVRFKAFPNEAFEGRVTFIQPTLEMATRTAKARIEVTNPVGRLRFEMFADVEIGTDAGQSQVTVPLSALIDSGSRKVVLVDRGEGRFEPRAVKTGRRNDGHVEILDGIKADENVVIAATFLIDAESNLKAALSAFTADASKPEVPKLGDSTAPVAEKSSMEAERK